MLNEKYIEQLFLVKLYRHSKMLFAIAAIYIMCLLLGCAFSHEEFPVFLFGMYSMKEPEQTEYETYSITAGGQEVVYDNLFDAQREVITSPLYHLAANASHQNVSQLSKWLFAYIADMRLVENNTMQIQKITCCYNSSGIPVVLRKETIINYSSE
jgi:hypothetical protein